MLGIFIFDAMMPLMNSISVAYNEQGCAMGNFVGGQLLEFFHITALLAAGVVMAAAGTASLFLRVNKKDIKAAP